MDTLELLRDLLDTKRVRFTFHTGGSVGTLKAGVEVDLRQGGDWIAAETEHWRLQIHRPSLAHVRFVEEAGGAIPVGHSIRFCDGAGNSLVRAYFPSPYMDEGRNVVPFRTGPLDLFRQFVERYRGRAGVELVQIGEIPAEADVFGPLIAGSEPAAAAGR